MVLVWLVACDSAAPPPAAKAPVVAAPAHPDVVIITLDTTRADHIGAYGRDGAETDTIDKLAAEGIRFNHAYSVLPLTIPAHSTIFTGLYPFHTNVRDNGAGVLAESFTTMAEYFKQGGYATGGSSGAFVTTRQWGFSQGFDGFYDEMPPRTDQPATATQNYWHTERPGESVVDDALAWLGTVPTDQPVFLWVHLYDAHYPYQPPRAYAERLPGHPYDAELAYVDDQVARVVEAFAGRKTVFALVGDHGESLGDHGERDHGMYDYDATQRVPWILSGTGVSPAVVEDPVSSADVLPTLLSLAGLPAPTGIDGHVQPGGKTVPYAESYQLVDRYRLAPHRMVVEGNLKLISKPKPELYDVVADPGETTNLAASRPADVARLQALYDALGATPPGCDDAPADAATIAQLTALGYVTGGCGAKVDPQSLPDPADFADFVAEAAALGAPGPAGPPSPEAVRKKLDALLARKPDAFELRMRKSRMLTQSGDVAGGKKFVEETAKLFPDDARAFVQLASMAMADRDPAQALVYAGRALDVDPKNRSARELSVTAQLTSGLVDDAIASGKAWFDDDPGNIGLAAVLGRFFLLRNDYEQAKRYLTAATSGANPHTGSRVELAALALTSGDRAGAYTLLEAEIGDFPRSVLAHRALARLHGDERDYLAQLDELRILKQLDGKNPDALRALAQCLFNLADYPGARAELDVALTMAPDDPDIVLLNANLLKKEGKDAEAAKTAERAFALKRAQTGEAAPSGNAAVAAPEPGAAPRTPENTLATPGGGK